MKALSSLTSKWLLGLAVGGAALALDVVPAAAQGQGGGGGGTGGGGGGQLGATGLGSRPLTGGGTTQSTPLGGQGAATTGGAGGAAGGTNAVSPATTNPFYGSMSSVLKPGLGQDRKLTTGNFKLQGGTGGGGAAGGGGGGAGGGSTIGSATVSGFTTFSTSGNIVTFKQGSLNQPLFAIATTGGGVGGRAATGGLGTQAGLGTGGVGTGTAGGFNSVGMIRAPQYITQIAFEPVAKPGPAVPLDAHVRNVLDRSTTFKAGKDIQVALDGGVVVLRGGVATDRDRRVAEAMVRMSPGVNGVRNEIVVNGK